MVENVGLWMRDPASYGHVGEFTQPSAHLFDNLCKECNSGIWTRSRRTSSQFCSSTADGILSIGNKSDLRLTELRTGESRLLADFGVEGSEEEMTFAPAIACEGRVVLGMRNDYVHCYKASDKL